jgi:copper chaperone
MVEKEFRIEGMNCQHCVMSVKKELGKIRGLEIRDVRIGSASVAYDASKVDPARVNEAIVEAGFKILPS